MAGATLVPVSPSGSLLPESLRRMKLQQGRQGPWSNRTFGACMLLVLLYIGTRHALCGPASALRMKRLHGKWLNSARLVSACLAKPDSLKVWASGRP